MSPGEKNRGGWWLGAGIAVLAGIWTLGFVRQHPAPVEDPRGGMRVGEVATSAQLLDTSGRRTELFGPEADFFLLAFSARDCPVCSSEADTWKALFAAGRAHRMQVSVVVRDTKASAIRSYVAVNDLSALPVLYDPQGKVFARYKVEEVPQYLLFDRSGRLLLRLSGAGESPEDRVKSVLAALAGSRGGRATAG